jgi:BT1 family
MTMTERVAGAASAVLLAPWLAFKREHLPPMMVYFAAGAAGLTSVASQFWIKEQLTLSPADLAGLAVWLGLPAVMKMVIGELVDTRPIFGSQRRAYIYIGAGLVALSLLILAGAASERLTFAAPNKLYYLAAILSAIGFVVQDVAADAMTTEVVARTNADGTPRPESEVNAELAMVQVLGRLFLSAGAISVSLLGGYLASIWSRSGVFMAGLVVPLISIAGAMIIAIDSTERRPTDWRILGGGLAFGLGVLAIGLFEVPFAQEITFVASLGIIGAMLARVTADIDPTVRKRIFYASLIIFWFRAYPNVGDGFRWFEIDRYGFDERFFGMLDFIGNICMFVTAWALAGAISRMRVTSVLVMLTVISTALAIPALILVFEGAMRAVEAATGIGPRSVALVDSAVQSPISNLAMFPMLTLIAIHAPAKSRAVWFSLMASFMNTALTAGELMTKYMNMIFVVDRGQYAALPAMTVWVTVVAFVLPMTAVWLWRRHVD